MKRILLRLFSWLTLILALPMGLAGAIVCFFGSAYLSAAPWFISTSGVLGGFLVAAGCSWFASGRIAPDFRLRMTIGTASGIALLIVLITAMTVFRPLVPAAETTTPSAPSAVRFWNLATGSRIAYLKFPTPRKTHVEPIVFLHGGPGASIVSAPIVTDTISLLAEDGYDVYFYDQVGGGFSQRLDDVRQYTLYRHIEDLESVRRTIGAERMILIGESFGGVLAAHYIAHHPDRVARCVLVSPGALDAAEWKGTPTGAPIDRLDADRRRVFQSKIRAHLPRLLLADILLDINPVAARRFISDREGDSFISAAFSVLLAGFTCDPENMPKNAKIHFGLWANQTMEKNRRPVTWNVNAMLASAAVPVLVLKGECDYVKWNVTWQYKKTFSNSTLLCIRGAGHMIYLEQRDVFMACLRAFLADTPPPLPPCVGEEAFQQIQ